MIIVRSQDKEILSKVKCLSISEISENGKIIQYSIDGEVTNENTYELGVYSTKEKALKVLDMIQEKIERRLNNELFVNCRTRSDCVTFVNSPVFQMLQDDEVEV